MFRALRQGPSKAEKLALDQALIGVKASTATPGSGTDLGR